MVQGCWAKNVGHCSTGLNDPLSIQYTSNISLRENENSWRKPCERSLPAMPCASTTTSVNPASSTLNACSSVCTTSGLTLQHPQAHDLRDILAGQLPPQTNPYYAPQFPPLHYQQPPQRFDFSHSIEHFQQTTPFGQTASAFHPQQQHPAHQQASSANTNHRLIRQRNNYSVSTPQ
ncbi:Hypothetical predicted protein [Paramuricea clavata]|nr:Hypothetical predicted protein [Paramuricea clavata]